MDTLLSLPHYLFSFALVISIIVFVHEFGHFIVARACGVKVEAFSIGFGPELVAHTDKHGTRWKIALFPVGGFVKMYGDAGAASTPDDAALTAMTPEQKRLSFHYKPLWAKALIVAAGPAFNFFLAITVFTYFIFTTGLSSNEPIIGEIMPNTPAAEAGLQSGDRVLSVDGKTMTRFNDIPDAIMTNLGTPVVLQIDRAGKQFDLTLTPMHYTDKDMLGNAAKRPLLGFRSQQITLKNVTLPHALWIATERTYGMCVTSLKVMGQMLTGQRSADELKGPLGIAKLSGQVTQQGDSFAQKIETFLWFVALLSVNLGLVNLLPIPMLDGGHLAFYCIEGLRGRPLADRFMDYSYRVGLMIVGSLMAFSLFNDVKQYF